MGRVFFSEKLVAAGNRVDGVDILETPERRNILGKYIQFDLDQGFEQILSILADRIYDCVLLLELWNL